MVTIIQTDKETFKRYLEDTYSNKKTRELYLNALEHRYPFITKTTHLSEDTIRLYIDKTMRSDRRKPNPFYMGFIKALIDCFDPKGTIPFKIKKDKSAKPKIISKPERLIEQEIQQLINHIDNPQISLMVQIYCDTGLRLMELIRVKRKNIDYRTHHMSGMGKKGKPFNVHYSKATAIRIYHWLKDQRNNPEHKSFYYPFMMLDAQNNPNKNQASAFRRKLKKYAKTILGKNIHPHLIRHALGYSLRAEKGWDMEQVRAKLRHTNINTTQIYTTATEEEIETKEDEERFQ